MSDLQPIAWNIRRRYREVRERDLDYMSYQRRARLRSMQQNEENLIRYWALVFLMAGSLALLTYFTR